MHSCILGSWTLVRGVRGPSILQVVATDLSFVAAVADKLRVRVFGRDFGLFFDRISKRDRHATPPESIFLELPTTAIVRVDHWCGDRACTFHVSSRSRH